MNLVFAGVVAGSSAVSVWLTYKLVTESRLLREAQAQPHVSVYAKTRDDWVGWVELVVENDGLGPAYDVRLTSEPDYEMARKQTLSKWGPFAYGLRFFPPRRKFITFLANLPDKYEEKIKQSFTVAAAYSNAAGKKLTERFRIDLAQFANQDQLGDPPMYSLAKSLKRIEESISRIARNRRLEVDAYSQRDRDAEARALKRWIREDRKRMQVERARLEKEAKKSKSKALSTDVSGASSKRD